MSNVYFEVNIKVTESVVKEICRCSYSYENLAGVDVWWFYDKDPWDVILHRITADLTFISDAKDGMAGK